MIRFDREIYFDAVRGPLFCGSMTQGQVDGQRAILFAWEVSLKLGSVIEDLRHLAYCLATAKHETANTMLPIAEHGEGAGHAYGERDPETGQTYYGRGFVQLTWRDNYARATKELDLNEYDDLEWFADNALNPVIAARVMFQGMTVGWFRPPNDLPLYFDELTNDAFGAREIINGDMSVVPDWSGGVSIGRLIADYHGHFHEALVKASAG